MGSAPSTWSAVLGCIQQIKNNSDCYHQRIQILNNEWLEVVGEQAPKFEAGNCYCVDDEYSLLLELSCKVAKDARKEMLLSNYIALLKLQMALPWLQFNVGPSVACFEGERWVVDLDVNYLGLVRDAAIDYYKLD